jgi:threonine dehydratase
MSLRSLRVPLRAPARALFPDEPTLERARTLVTSHASHGVRPARIERAESLDALVGGAGARVWLADESAQQTGSFKVRGAFLALEALRERGVGAVIAASAGNHGAGVALAARALGMRALIVVPSVAPAAKRDKIARFGAEIVVFPSPSYDEAEEHAMRLAEERGVAFLSAYDDAAVVAGNGCSLGFEIVRAIGRVPDVLLAPFGGGGLACGLAWALAVEAGDALDERRRVWGVQTEVSPSLVMSLERGAALERFSATEPTLAEGLEGGVARDAFERALSVIAGALVVDEGAIARAMAYAHRALGRALEGSAAVALAALREGLPQEVVSGSKEVVLVLTGSNVDSARLKAVLDASM